MPVQRLSPDIQDAEGQTNDAGKGSTAGQMNYFPNLITQRHFNHQRWITTSKTLFELDQIPLMTA